MTHFIKNKNIIKLHDFLKNQNDKNVTSEFKRIINFIIEFFSNSKYEKDINYFAKELVRKYYFESVRIQYIVSKVKSKSVKSESDDVSEQLSLLENKNNFKIDDTNFSKEVRDFYLKTIDLLPDELLKSFKDLVKIYNWIEFKEKCDDDFKTYFGFDIKIIDTKYKEKILDFIMDSYVDIINNKILLAISNGIKKEKKKKVVTVLIGKTGVGKSTLANIFEGYFNGLKDVSYKKIKIGHHSRGTKDYEMISIPLGLIEIVIVDTIGTCDTNTSEYSF